MRDTEDAPRIAVVAATDLSAEAVAVAAGAGVAATSIAVERSLDIDDRVTAIVCVPSVKVTRQALERLTRLRIVCTASAGYDHIDIDAARGLGISVARVVGNGETEVADHSIAMAAALLRGLVTSDRQLRQGVWAPPTSSGARRITGARLGVVGMGRIGRLVAERGAGLGMDVSVFARTQPPLDDRWRYVPNLPSLLRHSDVLSLHLPLCEATRGIIDAGALALMPPGSFLVNTGRGGLVDTAALSAALLSGQLAGAALDVFDSEPLRPGDAALELVNTLLTPHSAWFSPQSAVAAFHTSGSTVSSVLRGGEPMGNAEFVVRGMGTRSGSR